MYMKTSERSSREGGSPAREGGSPAREGGSPAREGGSPAREGGSPAREGGSPAREGSTQTVVMERQDPSASKSVVIAPCEVAVTPPCQNQIMAQTGMSESDQFRKALFQGKLRKPLTNIDLLKRIDVIQHHIRWLPPVEPPSRQCPGIYLKGCIGQLRLQCPDVRETVVWVCHIDVPNGKPSSCGYRYYPRPREAYPTLDLSLKSNTTFQVCAFDGSEDAVRGCGGIEPLVALAGIDVSKALHRDSKSGGDDGVCMSLEFPLDMYRVVHSCFAKLNKNIDMKIQPARGIPDNVLNFFLYPEENTVPAYVVEERYASLSKKHRAALLPFQRDGVMFGLERNGRCLIADEMGVGKTVQAISLAACYRDKWPLLIIVPASLRLSWAEEIEKWLPYISPNEIHIIYDKTDRIRKTDREGKKLPLINIVSYKMLQHLTCDACSYSFTRGASRPMVPCQDPHFCMASMQWKIVIADESHTIKTSAKENTECESRSTKAVRAVCSSSHHLIFLTGTPTLNRPFDLYHQVYLLRPDIFPSNKNSFADLYCDRRLVPAPFWGEGAKVWTKSGLTRANELHLLLRSQVMIRRLKKDVLDQLPEKIRQVVSLPKPKASVKETDPSSDSSQDAVMIDASTEYQQVGLAKCHMGCDWLLSKLGVAAGSTEDLFSDDLSHDRKFVVFAHHKAVMNSIAAALDEKFTDRRHARESSSHKIEFVRVDGDTDAAGRQQAVMKFKQDPSIRVALLSVTAAGVGLDFSSASAVVFFELPQQASLVRQAEDRVHRRGNQKSSVNIYFLCARGTYDERLWQQLNRNLRMVDCLHDGPQEHVGRSQSFQTLSRAGVTGLAIDSIINLNSQYFNIRGESEGEIEASKENMEVFHAEDDKEGKNPASLVMIDSEEDSISEQDKEIQGDVIDLTKNDDVIVNAGPESNDWWFEISNHTNRVHFYSTGDRSGSLGISVPLGCLIANDFELVKKELIEVHGSRSQDETCFHFKIGPVFVNESLSPSQLGEALNAARQFAWEWQEIPSNFKCRLVNKCIQPPLDLVLEEEQKKASAAREYGRSTNRFVSKHSRGEEELRRLIQRYPIIQDADWIRGVVHYAKTDAPYEQAVVPANKCSNDVSDENLKVRLCLQCYKAVPYSACEHLEPHLFSPCLLYCSSTCEKKFTTRSSSSAARYQVFKRDRGVCAQCGLDCAKLVRRIQYIEQGIESWKERRRKLLEKDYPDIIRNWSSKSVDNLIARASQGNAWQADHIVPVFGGGGECDLINLRTLCTCCHQKVTSEQNNQRRRERQEAKRKQKSLGTLLIGKKKKQRKILDEDSEEDD